ncbi:nuclear transport factor 2 family protein [Gordonia rhizosphera]|uniref:SnoaL-like domain-containing protein n=1 Tax=Gordonia rhizosphera NBRC 16068 TaxID=1108045 RepID=K6VWP0_9ACTN|nr:nuclear transport factor 2 family protein [Gordonia rhizosphera]GAB91295.1 hypothetical protein GORHZ_126_00360 [Gordonia rhizosphera NBRC 16068]
MSSLAALSIDDRAEIVQLVGDYGYHHDERDFGRLGELFTDDALYTMVIAGGDTIGPRQGRDAIVAQISEFKSRQSDIRRHVITNITVTIVNSDAANVRSYVSVLATTPERTEVVTAGVYHDRVVRQGGRWLIAEKLLRLDRSF